MSTPAKQSELLDEGTLSFTIESRIIRELGERLVKQPDVALLELVKNAYDADAKTCEIVYEPSTRIVVSDDGHGMSLDDFKNGWMRIGTSSKEARDHSRGFGRVITGEKGIGRFAVRFLGKALHLETVAMDQERGFRTLLTAHFDWPVFDHNADLGKVKVPYWLTRAEKLQSAGTRLTITQLRPSAANVNLNAVRTASVDVVTPYHALLKSSDGDVTGARLRRKSITEDPGFALRIQPTANASDDGDLSKAILDNFVLRAIVKLTNDRLSVEVYRQGAKAPSIKIADRYPNTIGSVYADIRFFPQRKGTFVNLPVDGRIAKTWVKEHSGVAIFDRTFRVHPYGMQGDDWLFLSSDTAKSMREPRSSIAQKHLPMDDPTRASTQLNYMLRLPYPQQLVGIVQVAGRRTRDQGDDDDGLIAAADREGFVDNSAYRQLRNIIRGAAEAIAAADRELQLEQDRVEQEQLLDSLRAETQEAIQEIQSNPNIGRVEKSRIVKQLTQTQVLAEKFEEHTRQREATLEVMSLLGVVAGFMTHEFGTALDEIERAHQKIAKLARRDEHLKEVANGIADHIANLREFVTYSQGYIQGASARPSRPYTVRPRVQQVVRVFGKYALDRQIDVETEIDAELLAPLVPVSLYNGIALNLFTNALKAVTAKAGEGDRKIAFRSWNEQQWHFLEVSDTGIGIPTALRKRIFDPLFTTTATNRDPLGSGMGLGLSLVKRGAESYGGRVEAIDPPAGFSTCVRLRLPLTDIF